MDFSQFASLLQQVENTAGRNDTTVLLAEFFNKLSKDEIKPMMYLIQGRVAPQYEPIEFNFALQMAIKALQTLTEDDLSKEFGKLGDIGLLAEKVIKEARTKDTLSIKDVYEGLKKITEISGTGSQDLKSKAFLEVVTNLEPSSAKYVARMVIGELRLGVSDKTILDALSWAKTGDKSLRKDLDRAYGFKADIGAIAELILNNNLEQAQKALLNIKLEAGVPIASKLVEREANSEAVFKRTGPALLQPKLDGLRAQIHLRKTPDEFGQKAFVFSRNMESMTDIFPDLVEAVQKLGVDSIIIDSEAIGYDSINETYIDFQTTMQRRRKNDIEATAQAIPVRSMAFDLLYLNGEDWTERPVEDRTAKLREILDKSDQNTIKLLETVTVNTQEEMEDYFLEQVGKGLEGIIIKSFGTTYEPGTRNFNWIKLKANTKSDLVDTIDAVVIGYYYGQGDRARFGLGALLVALYNPSDEKFYSLGKVGSGMTEEGLTKIKQDLDKITLESGPTEEMVVNKVLYPDVWVKPQIVVEIIADEITRSKAHTAAIELPANFEKDTKGRGLSVRFPRLKVWGRDKDAIQSTTVQELVRMYELRKGNK